MLHMQMRGSATTMTAMRASLQGSPAQHGITQYGQVSQFDQPKRAQPADVFGQKFVIALCRKSVASEDEILLDESDKKNGQLKSIDNDINSCVINNSGVLEYTRHNLNQYYQVEEVLSMVDVSNEG